MLILFLSQFQPGLVLFLSWIPPDLDPIFIADSSQSWPSFYPSFIWALILLLSRLHSTNPIRFIPVHPVLILSCFKQHFSKIRENYIWFLKNCRSHLYPCFGRVVSVSTFLSASEDGTESLMTVVIWKNRKFSVVFQKMKLGGAPPFPRLIAPNPSRPFEQHRYSSKEGGLTI